MQDVDWVSQDSPAHRSSFSVSTIDDIDDFDDSFVLPPASQTTNRRAQHVSSVPSDRTPLVPQDNKGPSKLFGGRDLHWEKRSSPVPSENSRAERPSGLAGFFFGFMYEEACPTDDLVPSKEQEVEIWNRLNWALFLAYSLSTAATTVPVTLIPTAASDLVNEASDASLSAFTARATTSAVMGTACGKLLNGPAVDIFGSRRVSSTYALLLSLSLLALALSQGETSASWACFAVEFCQSVQWPCIIVILAAHYTRRGGGMYEGGIYVTSLASRFGSLMAIPVSSLLLRNTHWRVVARCGALVSTTAAIIMYCFVPDSPNRRNDPQNPISESTMRDFKQKYGKSQSMPRKLMTIASFGRSVVYTNLVPSLCAVLKSGTFWIVAVAHTGSAMVRTSEHILATYFRDTSFGTLSENRASGLVVCLSFGTIFGLAIGGSLFARRNAKGRKRMVSKLYMMAIASCYILAILAIPRLRLLFGGALGMVLAFQVMATFCMGFGIAVQCFQIPGLVGATFGHYKGLYAAYTDGIAYGLGAYVWRIVGGAVQEGNPQGGGWAYGWAGVALMLVLCAVLMVEFMEHYFVRKCKSSAKQGGGYETIIFV